MRKSVPFIIWTAFIIVSMTMFIVLAIISKEPLENYLMPVLFALGLVVGSMWNESSKGK